MNPRDPLDRPSPQALDEDFKRRARLASRDAADGLLARGRAVSYRENDTPAGHVIRRYPDGRTETVKIDLSTATAGRQSA
ncbi:hypothetical protein [Sphingomonas sp.]|jgi:hypothetical protein|uniref:hypothetical protein n=1 Tax=Sphingomonas sp. TaxID=28214 RepID=UPI002ED98A38